MHDGKSPDRALTIYIHTLYPASTDDLDPQPMPGETFNSVTFIIEMGTPSGTTISNNNFSVVDDLDVENDENIAITIDMFGTAFATLVIPANDNGRLSYNFYSLNFLIILIISQALIKLIAIEYNLHYITYCCLFETAFRFNAMLGIQYSLWIID